MDDLKVFAKTEPEKKRPVATMKICSRDKRIESGVSKCAVLTLKWGGGKIVGE